MCMSESLKNEAVSFVYNGRSTRMFFLIYIEHAMTACSGSSFSDA